MIIVKRHSLNRLCLKLSMKYNSLMGKANPMNFSHVCSGGFSPTISLKGLTTNFAIKLALNVQKLIYPQYHQE